MNTANPALPIGRRVSLPGHFEVAVVLEDARPLGVSGSGGYECRVRLPDGTLDEAVISPAEAAALAGLEDHEAGSAATSRAAARATAARAGARDDRPVR